ncbi:hypothetical protein BV22DRAFT_1129994 [Leucogyrophana mollusca]|uniref:Uncharacterized protein n=1 Tax=Leucogyrophana mollusca TaxID=85980 RepID=A0ACB8BI53_9AGAM|nr:hypothetical protein BV22DRAFT_1129994 [Leucogyrophana mollusca]
MPLFNSTHSAPPTVNESPQRTRSIFGSRSDSPTSDTASHTYSTSNGVTNFFKRRSPSPSDDSSSSSSFFHGRLRDPSIAAARQKVADAESAEKAADKALLQARTAAKAAKEHIKMLEREALEDARRAKAKRAEAKSVKKSARSLGRHG